MNLNPTPIIALFLGFGLSLQAQTLEETKKPAEPSEEVRRAIEEFNRMKREKLEKANEVTVVLEPPAPPKAKVADIQEKPEPEAPEELAEEDTEEQPVLVTGKPQEDTEKMEPVPTEEVQSEPEPTPEPELEPELVEVEEPGLEVRVESLRKGSGQIDPKSVKLKASFPAKPLSSVPDGWIMEKSAEAPPFNRDIELQPGTVISLEISPHVLIPDADGSNVFSVDEPGFDALNGYRQKETVSAILEKSVVQLDEDAKQLGNVLSELHQILASLPKPPNSESVPLTTELDIANP